MSFKVKTADGESWEWDIHTADDDETEDAPERDEVGWNRGAILSLAIGMGLSFIGLLTLLISIGLLFSAPGGMGGLIAGAVLLCAGFIIVTPSAIYLVGDPKSDARKDRDRSESVAIILPPKPDFRKNILPSNPQQESREDRYLLAAERLTAMLEEPEADTKEVSTAAWTPTPSPRGSPKIAERPPSFGSSLSVSIGPGKTQAPRGSPRVIKRVNTSSLKKKQPDPPPTFSTQPVSSAILVPPNRDDDSGIADDSRKVSGSGNAADSAISGVEYSATIKTTTIDNGTNVTTYHSKSIEVSQSESATPIMAPSLTPSGSQRIKVAAPIAAPSVVEFDSDDEDLKKFLLSVKKQNDAASSAILY